MKLRTELFNSVLVIDKTFQLFNRITRFKEIFAVWLFELCLICYRMTISIIRYFRRLKDFTKKNLKLSNKKWLY